MSNFHTDTRGRWWSLFKVKCSVVLCGGGTLQTNITEACGQRSQCFSRTGFAPRSRRVCFHVPHFSGSRLLCWELCEAGPGLRALPRFKSLRFRFSGTPQRPRLSWACILCLSQSQAAQVTRCVVSAVTPRCGVRLIASPVPAAWFCGCTLGAPSQPCRVSLRG